MVKKIYMMMTGKNVSSLSFMAAAALTIALWKIDIEMSGGGSGFVYLQMAFTKEAFVNMISSWRSGSVELLMSYLWVYFLYPLAYGALFASTPAYFIRQRKDFTPETVPAKELLFFSAPFAAGLFDWISLLLLFLIFKGGPLSSPLIFAMSVSASLKWLMMAFSLLLILRSYFTTRKEKKSIAE